MLKYLNTDERKFVFQLAWIVFVIGVLWIGQRSLTGNGYVTTDMLVIGGSNKYPAKIMATVLPDGDPKLLIYDANGKSLLDIWASNRGQSAMMTFYGAGGKSSLVIEVAPGTGKPRIRFVDPVTGQTTILPDLPAAPEAPKTP